MNGSQQDVRAPVVRVLYNGTELPAALSATHDGNGWYQADRFDITFALWADANYGPNFWGSTQPMLVDVQVAFVQPNIPTSWTSLVVGEVDHVDLDFEGGTVHVSGRDLTARFSDTKTQETFTNQTFSQVCATLAARHGMTTNVTPTTTQVGRYYQIDHDQVTLGQFQRTTNEWDLLVDLARHEGFDVWVKGTVLHAIATVAPGTPATTYPVTWAPPSAASSGTSNIIGLHTSRSLVLARDVLVKVKSWHSKTGRGFVKTAGRKQFNNRNGDQQQVYVYTRANMDEAAAQKLANKLLEDLTRAERLVEFSFPADFTLSPRWSVVVSGTSSSWDQTYVVDTVTRTIDQSGFTMQVRCKNHSADSQAVIA